MCETQEQTTKHIKETVKRNQCFNQTSQPMREEMEENLNLFNLFTQTSKRVFSHWVGGIFKMKH